LASNIVDLQSSHLTFIRSHPERPGALQCGFLTDLEPAEAGMTYVVSDRSIRVKWPSGDEVVLLNTPGSMLAAVLHGSEFWVANVGGSEDAFMAVMA